MKKYTQDEIETIAERFTDELAAGDRVTGREVRGAALIELSRLIRDGGVTDQALDIAVARARKGGHSWDEIEHVLHDLGETSRTPAHR